MTTDETIEAVRPLLYADLPDAGEFIDWIDVELFGALDAE